MKKENYKKGLFRALLTGVLRGYIEVLEEDFDYIDAYMLEEGYEITNNPRNDVKQELETLLKRDAIDQRIHDVIHEVWEKFALDCPVCAIFIGFLSGRLQVLKEEISNAEFEKVLQKLETIFKETDLKKEEIPGAIRDIYKKEVFDYMSSLELFLIVYRFKECIVCMNDKCTQPTCKTISCLRFKYYYEDVNLLHKSEYPCMLDAHERFRNWLKSQ